MSVFKNATGLLMAASLGAMAQGAHAAPNVQMGTVTATGQTGGLIAQSIESLDMSGGKITATGVHGEVKPGTRSVTVQGNGSARGQFNQQAAQPDSAGASITISGVHSVNQSGGVIAGSIGSIGSGSKVTVTGGKDVTSVNQSSGIIAGRIGNQPAP